MACRERHRVFRVLTGELAPAKSTAMLEHFRTCGECREAFESGAKTIRRTGAVPLEAASAEGEDEGDTGSRGPMVMPMAWAGRMKKNRRTMLVFGVAIVALMIAGVGRGRADPQAGAEPAAEVLWRHALAEGTPVVQSPLGVFDARPRVITALVPVGSSQVRVVVEDDAGRVVFEREAKPGVEGCFLEEAGIDAPGGGFRAGRLLVPFPDEASLVLVPGRACGVTVRVAGGHASSSAVFQVRPAEGR
jgi:hypothetical protein